MLLILFLLTLSEAERATKVMSMPSLWSLIFVEVECVTSLALGETVMISNKSAKIGLSKIQRVSNNAKLRGQVLTVSLRCIWLLKWTSNIVASNGDSLMILQLSCKFLAIYSLNDDKSFLLCSEAHQYWFSVNICSKSTKNMALDG